MLLGGLSSPLAIRGAVSGGRGLWVGQQKLVQPKWAVVPLLSWNRSPGVTWLGLTGQSHWLYLCSIQDAATASAFLGMRQSPQHMKRVLAGLEVCRQRLSIFKISLWLCIPLSNSYYLKETIFLEALSCWEETSCCGQWSDTILGCLNPKKH